MPPRIMLVRIMHILRLSQEHLQALGRLQPPPPKYYLQKKNGRFVLQILTTGENGILYYSNSMAQCIGNL